MEASELARLLIGTMAQYKDMEVFVNIGGEKVRAVVDFDDCRDENGTRFIALTVSDIEKSMYNLEK